MSDYNDDPDSILRGLFGSLTSAASEGLGAQNMWNALRTGAYNWASSVLNVTSPTPPTVEEITNAANGLISSVTVTDMNRYASLAGQYLRAKNELAALGPNDQIPGTAIFSPPWANTADNPAVPTRFRIRVLRDITVHGFTAINRQEWATYELGGTLTTLNDAINAANTLFAQADYNARADINSVLDYSIETV
jgi:hypothetical protein